MASINALYLATSGVQVPLEVYNFGSPRFANENLAQFVKLKIPNHLTASQIDRNKFIAIK